MNLVDTIILGIVEGLTEFLPISSTGHLILTSHLLGLKGEAKDTFMVFIQLGAILAVVLLYSQRFTMLFQFKNNRPGQFAGLHGWMLLAITSLPALIVGLLCHDYIKSQLFGPTTVAWALGIGGIAIIGIEQLKLKSQTEDLDNLTLKQALSIGLFQCLSLWPGVSRAGATIIGGLFSGLNRKLAAEYSFIAAVPIMCVAVAYDLYKSLDQLNSNDLVMFAVGFIVAFISAVLAIKFFIHLVQKTTLSPFGVYRIAIAFLVLWIMG